MLSIIKNKFPWWFKILTKLILSRLPISYNFWSKINIFRHGQMDNSDYAFKIFSHHIHQEENKLNGKTILEIGPGDSLSSGIIAYYYGAKSILVNPSKFIFDPLENFNNLKIFLENKGFKVIDTPTNLDELCKKHKISYFVDGLESLKSIESNSVDIIFSNAVLEHIEKKEFKDTIKELKRIMKKDGFMSHQIDFKDHLDKSLNNLRFNDFIWESYFFRNSGFYTNRLRFKEMVNIFENANLRIQSKELKKWEVLPLSINKFSKEFREADLYNLLISGAKLKLVDSEK